MALWNIVNWWEFSAFHMRGLPVRSRRLEGVLESMIESNNSISWSLANLIQTYPCIKMIQKFHPGPIRINRCFLYVRFQ